MKFRSLFTILILALSLIFISCGEDEKEQEKTPDPVCGNAKIEASEICDKNQVTCTEIDSEKYESGMASCNDTCTYDLSLCILIPVCNNGEKEGDEVCDSDSVECSTVDLNKPVGQATCNNTCDAYDTSLCEVAVQNLVMKLNVTTATYNGRFAPRNVFAIWIENESGDYVKTLLLKAQNFKVRLNKWYYDSDRGNSGMIDAVTSASRTSHETETLSWDLKDKDQNKVPDGNYTIWFELNETNDDSKQNSVKIKIGDTSEVLEVNDTAEIKDIEVSFE